MTFELQPRLVGELVELRPLSEEDWEALYAVARDPLIWEQHPERDRWREPVFQSFFAGALESGGAFTVVERATGEVIGSTRYHGHDKALSEVEIGWTFLARRCWGGRHNGEMKRLMIEHALQFVERIVFLVGTENRRSQRAVERLGAVREGVVERDDRNGLPARSYRYVVTRADWSRPKADPQAQEPDGGQTHDGA